MNATVTIRKLLGKPGKFFGYGVTALGEIVYVPGRLVPRLSVGQQVEAKLKPSSDPRCKYFMVDLVDPDNNAKPKSSRGLIIYDRNDLNIVPRGTRSSNGLSDS